MTPAADVESARAVRLGEFYSSMRHGTAVPCSRTLPKSGWLYRMPRRYWAVLIFVPLIFLASLLTYLTWFAYTAEELRDREQSVSFDLSTYSPSYLINQANVCSIFSGNKWPAEGATGPALSILLYVHSRPGHFARRTFLRQAWLHPRFADGENYSIRSVFIVGKAHDPSGSIQKKLQEESTQYHDLIQGDFVDVYENLTIKEAAALAWADTHCSSASFVVKADDDTIIKPWALTETIRRHFDVQDIIRQPAFLCKVYRYEEPHRNPRKKYFTPRSQYAQDVFPVHCGGALRITTSSTVSLLLQSFVKAPYLWLENVFFTGVVAKLIGASHSHEDYLLRDTDDFSIGYAYFTRRHSPWVALHAHNLKLVRQIWTDIMANTPEHFQDGLDKRLPQQHDKEDNE
ncbi:hypothetical protein RvY_03394 [Ramazzottius varieornatus]|uniref:Hexosyltransferase n=1 Tax=Ramazzottius varieornatus TaxID=947166 RepID=A0A1D1URA7_RAMVA|nr:hypothetical protein RvY_03394 [Ramazzottius varieornatus]